MECGACSYSFGSMALLCGNGMVLSRKTMSFSLNMKSDSSLKANPCIGLDFLHSFQNCTNRLKTPSKNSRENRPLCATSIRCDNPQNTDFPRYYGKRDKKPFPVPVVELRRAARERAKKMRGKPRTPVPPPRNGMLVKSLIPVAYDVFNNRMTMINNLKRLLKVVPAHACRWCNEVHVGPTGHPFRSCRGQKASERNGLHHWGSATVDDVFPPVECYHLYDRMARRIPHEQRFSIPRLPALVELSIQAGVEIPEFPAKRRRKPVIRISKSEFIDADESALPDPSPDPSPRALLEETPDFAAVAPEGKDEIALVAEEALRAWTEMRRGAKKLMMMYRVRACGYCLEVHVGSDGGHRAQNCGAHKHQQRNGQHGWQSAVLDDLVPPRYVWHVPDVAGPPLQRELRSFYGQAPAVVEMCVQAGASIPDKFKGTMRLDIGIPDDPKEAEMVV